MKGWYLLYCKRGEQARAKSHLENQGVECFYPQMEVEKILRGKRKKYKSPFSRLIFSCVLIISKDQRLRRSVQHVALSILFVLALNLKNYRKH
ncbi:hypothetical protein CAG60_15090 [Vibrio sp. V33_P6A3T137]|nr:hypothetical protein [Vibrio sp. V33_P6A3T137]